MSELKIRLLNEVDKAFVAEYVRIMEPFTEALDLLQNEEKMSAGCILPTIALLKKKFVDFAADESIIHCQEIVTAVLGGLNKRFLPMFEDYHLRLASLSDPNFKTIWVDDFEEERKEADIRLLKEAVKRKASAMSRFENLGAITTDSESIQEPPLKKKRFLDGYKDRRSVGKESDEVERFLSEPTGDISDLERFPMIKQVFIEENSALPSSAACERLFSTAGLIFQPKRSNLTDWNFERLVFLKLNKNCMHNWRDRPSTTKK